MEPRAQPPKFLELLDEAYIQEDKKREETPRVGYNHNPSSASIVQDDGTVVGACLRSLYYKVTQEPSSDARDLTSRLQADFGNGIHDRLQEKLGKNSKIRLLSENPGKVLVDSLTHEISFRLDGLVTHKGEQGCLEIKTMQSFGLQRMVKEGGPKPAHILQILCYLATNENLRWAALIYFGRDNAYRAEYHVYKDPETQQYVLKGITPNQPEKAINYSFDKIVSRWKELEVAVEKKELPRRDFKAVLDKEGKVTAKRTKNGIDFKTSYQCSYCSWQAKCWAEPGAEEDAVKLGR